MPESNFKQFKIAAIKQFFVTSIMLFVQMIIFFVSAGSIGDPRPWLYFGTVFVHYSLSTAVQYRLNPQLLVQRLKRKREGSKLWDEILMRASKLPSLLLVSAVVGLSYLLPL